MWIRHLHEGKDALLKEKGGKKLWLFFVCFFKQKIKQNNAACCFAASLRFT
jgi:hypothetical protein